MLSKSKLDQLGNRLRLNKALPEDLRLLDEYRRSFEPAVEHVTQQIAKLTETQPTARPAKSTLSIAEKLKREKIRLSQMQDIAGCRVVLRSTVAQQIFLGRSENYFPSVEIMDRRIKPSHGYRAVHVLSSFGGKVVEIQVRTELQHLWAQVSEAYADRFGSEIKYGSGEPETRRLLLHCSERIQKLEAKEVLNEEMNYEIAQQHVAEFDSEWAELRAALQNMMRDAVT